MATKRRVRWPLRASERERTGDLREILKNRGVVALLVGTAAVSGVGTWAELGPASDRQSAAAVAASTALVKNSAVPVDPFERAENEKRAAELEAQRLADDYARQGYDVDAALATEIAAAALKHDIDLDIAFGLIRAESSFRTTATSPVGAVGLTQLMPKTAAWMQPGVSRSALRNPRTNLDVGFKYLRYLLDKYEGNEDLALLAYNRGPGTVDKALKRGRSPDNGYAAFVRGQKNHGHRLFTE